MTRDANPRNRLMLLGILVLALLVGLGYQQLDTTTQAAEETVEQAPAEPKPEGQLGMPAFSEQPYLIADIAEETSPAIVYIKVEWPARETRSQAPADPFRDFFDFWFSPFPRPPSEQVSQGTGFVIDESGIVLTNQHVVGSLGDGQTITVTISGEDYEAELLGADATLDLAVLQLTNDTDTSFPVVQLGNSDASRPGEWVIAIGNPYGKQFEHTVTVGVLSAKGREISIRNPETGASQTYSNLMQTDAAINRGNSGGPLLNIEGAVIGINTAVHAQAQGIGFAIPINIAKDVLDELIETGGVKHDIPPRAWLGVWYLGVTEELVQSLRISVPDTKGILITDVISGSPAEQAGLKARDIVRIVNEKDILSEEDFAEAIGESEPDETIVMHVWRDGGIKIIEATLGDMPAEMRF